MSNSSIMDTLFQRSLEDLIKGIRLQAPDSSTTLSTFISKSMEEIRREIKSTDPHTKSTALLKLTYLNSLYGLDMSWAAFHIVEVISNSQFPLKKIGYLAAAACFNETTEVILLVTNQLRKDLSSPNDFEVSIALHCLSVIATADLSRDLCNDIYVLLSSTRSYVRKKAIAVVLRVFSKYPDAVRVCFKRLVDNLDSTDHQAVCATVGVFCELALREPKAYLPLAPEFYKILLESKNNWVLIKVLKIFAQLAPLEPRLAKKIVEPICDIMRRTMAKSLLFECIRTVVSSLSDCESAVKLAVLKIREFLGEDDPNLKYLGLQALSDLASRHLWAVLENKEAVITSLSDLDPNIKLVSLRLLMAMVSEDNVAEITKVLLNYALKSDPEFCNEILRSILDTCSRNYYEIVFDFDWYVSLLGDMSRIPHCQTGAEIEYQLVDIGLRVNDARPELVNVGRDLLIDPALLGNPFLHSLLSGAAWVSGEYIEFSQNPFELMEALLQPRTNLLPPSIRAVYIQSAFKVLVFCLQSFLWQQDEVEIDSKSGLQLSEGFNLATQGSEAEFEQVVDSSNIQEYKNGALTGGKSLYTVAGKESSILRLINITETALAPLSWSLDVEVQERARNVLGVLQLVNEAILVSAPNEKNSEMKEADSKDIAKLIRDMFADEIGPVSVNAQSRIPVPDDLMLIDNLSDLEKVYSDMQLHSSSSFSLGTSHHRETEADAASDGQSKEDLGTSSKSDDLLSQHRKRHGLFYLSTEKDDANSYEYPLANESKVLESEVNDLVKLTGKSLTIKKKPNPAKPRPVVVKLDEGDSFIPKKKLQSSEDLLSGAVTEFLLSNEEVSTSSSFSEAVNQFAKRKGKAKESVDGLVDLKDNSSKAENFEIGNPGSGRRKHRGHGKERRHQSHTEQDDGKSERSRKEKKKSSRQHHSRHTANQNQGDSVVAVQTSPIPDFLL